MDIIYFGTSEYSTILLDKIKFSEKLNLKLVITKPDKTVGRKQELLPSPVKEWCIKNDIAFITPESLKKEKDEVLKAIRNSDAKLGLVADYGLMIPQEIIESFEKGIINVHFSLLPKYRGASPVTYTILNGDKETGITFLMTTAQMDKGDILKQIPFKIVERYNDKTLYETLFVEASNHVEEVLTDYGNELIKPNPQDESQATYATPSTRFDRTTYILKEDARINWNLDPRSIERAIRAFYPWPVAWTTLGELIQAFNLKTNKDPNLKVKIHEATLDNEEKLQIQKIQVEGKNIVSFEDFKNGYISN